MTYGKGRLCIWGPAFCYVAQKRPFEQITRRKKGRPFEQTKNKKHQKQAIFVRKCIFLISNSERAYKKVRVWKIWWVFVERMASKHQTRS